MKLNNKQVLISGLVALGFLVITYSIGIPQNSAITRLCFGIHSIPLGLGFSEDKLFVGLFYLLLWTSITSGTYRGIHTYNLMALSFSTFKIKIPKILKNVLVGFVLVWIIIFIVLYVVVSNKVHVPEEVEYAISYAKEDKKINSITGYVKKWHLEPNKNIIITSGITQVSFVLNGELDTLRVTCEVEKVEGEWKIKDLHYQKEN